MTATDTPTTDWDDLPDGGTQRLRAVGNNEPAPGGAKQTHLLEAGKNGPRQHPDHVRWLRTRLGAGPLSWAFLRGPDVVRVTCIGEDGYREPIRHDDDNGPATVAPLGGQQLSTRLSDAYTFVMIRKYGDKEVQTEEWFPAGDCQRALDTPDLLPHLRPLRGVTHTPILRAGRGMLTTPGYDPESGFLYQPVGDIPDVPAEPTADQVRAAVDRIRGLIADFSWAGEHDEANFVGALLTPLMRLACPPPYKALAIGAHQRGSGKSLLAQVLRTIHGGTLRTWPATEEELGKQITSILSQTTAPICQFDNIRGLIRSGKLDALLTTRVITDRVLGTTNDTGMINDRLWAFTGNNLTLGGDLDRRVVWVMIDPGVERPEDRTGFAIPNLAEHVQNNRTPILRDLLTMLGNWDTAGRPTDEPTSDSFGPWVAAIRGVLTVCGMPGTFDHTDSRSDNVDPDAEEAAEFLAAIEAMHGTDTWTVRDLTAAMVDPAGIKAKSDYDLKGAAIADAYPTSARGKHWRPTTPYHELTRPLGYWLRHREGQWFDGLRVVKASGRKDRADYRIEHAKRPGGAR